MEIPRSSPPKRELDSAYTARVAAAVNFSRATAAANLLGLVVSVLVLYPYVAAPVLAVWGVGVAGWIALRFWIGHTAPEAPYDMELAWRMHRRLRVISIGAILWSMLGVLVPETLPLGPVMVLTILFCGALASSAIALSGLRDLTAIYMGAILLGAQVMYWRLGPEQYWQAMVVIALLAGTIITLLSRTLRIIGAGAQIAQLREQSAKQVSVMARELQRRTRMIRQVIGQARVGLIASTPAGLILYAGGRALATMGASTTELEGSMLAELPDPLCRLDEVRRRALSGEAQTLRWRSARWAIDWQAELLGDPGDPDAIVILSGIDVSEPVRNRNLQQAFLSTVNHRLRTPLAKIQAALELAPALEREDMPTALAGGLRGVSEIEALIERLSSFEDDLADDIPRVPTRASEIAEALRRAFESIDDRVRFASVLELGPAPECSVLLEPAALVPIATELIENAAVHSQPGSAIRVNFQQVGAADAGTELKIEMSNQAASPGRAAGRTLADHDDAAHHGFRMGLFLVERIVQRHGGRFEFQLGEDGRAITVVHLPIVLSPRGGEA